MTSNISLFDLIILDWALRFPVRNLLCSLQLCYLFILFMCVLACIFAFYVCVCIAVVLDSTISIIALFCINNLMRNNACIYSNHNEICYIHVQFRLIHRSSSTAAAARCNAFQKYNVCHRLESVICARFARRK